MNQNPQPPERPSNLLRFISRDLDLRTIVAKEGDHIFVQLEKENQIVGKRRLAKAKCCQSESPCIGTVPIGLEFQEKFGLPSFVHVSLCYDQITDVFDKQNQTYPRTF